MPCKSVLVKCGVPPTMLNIIQSFHKGMEASVRVRDGVNDSFEDRNGLWQVGQVYNLDILAVAYGYYSTLLYYPL